MHAIAIKEPFYGNSKTLDQLYFQSVAIGALIDHLENDNNSTPEDNEFLLQCLKNILSKNICGCQSTPSTPQYQQPNNTLFLKSKARRPPKEKNPKGSHGETGSNTSGAASLGVSRP
jgi:hypothetical protein